MPARCEIRSIASDGEMRAFFALVSESYTSATSKMRASSGAFGNSCDCSAFSISA